jgi:hypothetical protein
MDVVVDHAPVPRCVRVEITREGRPGGGGAVIAGSVRYRLAENPDGNFPANPLMIPAASEPRDRAGGIGILPSGTAANAVIPKPSGEYLVRLFMAG